ncbi:hypothetical protein NQZ68_019387 [Dissostichus eleginoides]|nr:hypothetical protein NQZ68_019387 [Dissostichus eleginoides]
MPDYFSTSMVRFVHSPYGSTIEFFTISVSPKQPSVPAGFDRVVSTDRVTVITSKSSSEKDFYSGTLKRIRKEEESFQGPQAKNLIKQVLLTKPGGSDVLKEYEEKGTISPATRKVLVNILVADMVESEGGDEPSLESPEWDSDMASILLLLHLLSPQPAGRKKTQKISVAQAIDHLVVFHKSCRSLDEHLQSHIDTSQPYLLASGTSKEAIGNFFILIDKKLIPCEATTSLAAIDELF